MLIAVMTDESLGMTGFNLAGALHMNCRRMGEQMDNLGEQLGKPSEQMDNLSEKLRKPSEPLGKLAEQLGTLGDKFGKLGEQLSKIVNNCFNWRTTW